SASERRVESPEARVAACGWNAAAPIPPSMTSATRWGKLSAEPTELRNRAATSGPKATNHGRSSRSENQPKSGCENDEASEESATRAPMRVRLKPSFATSSGSSGDMKLE